LKAGKKAGKEGVKLGKKELKKPRRQLKKLKMFAGSWRKRTYFFNFSC